MGEARRKLEKRKEMLLSCAGVQTMAGKVQVRWETESAATPMGQLAYFIEFLHLTGLWSRWLAGCPLTYSSPNAPSIADVLGTWMLSILSGHRRYSHVTTIRGDGVNPGLLEMDKVVSEDALRKGLLRIPEAAGTTWLDGHLDESTAALLDAGWIFDTDTTVKVLYGHQEGAVVAYNPKKPGRPSHSYHTYLMAGLRLVLGVEVHAGNEHSSKHGQPGLLKILDALPSDKKPGLVRGDNGYGTDGLMVALEEREQPYLFKLKLSKNVKRHISRLCDGTDWTDAYNWWSLFVRLANPEARREAITSRLWLMTSVGRKTEHAGQTTVTLTGLHAHFEQARAALMRVSALLQGWVAETAEQLTRPSVWHRVCDHLKQILAGIAGPPTHPLLGNYANEVG